MSTFFFDNVNRVDVDRTRELTDTIRIVLHEELPDGGIMRHEIQIIPTWQRRFDIRKQTIISKPVEMEVGS